MTRHVFTTATVILLGSPVCAEAQAPSVRPLSEEDLRAYEGVYRWGSNDFVYLQIWNEFTGKSDLVAFDESGDVRVLYPTDQDVFFTGPGAAVPSAVESLIRFRRDGDRRVTELQWRSEGAAPRIARRVDAEKSTEVRFRSADVELTGTLTSPAAGQRHPVIVLVHGSGAQDRRYMLPFARFLIRHGVAVLGYDKRGVGGSSGDWRTASFEDLATDVVAAVRYLKTRSDVDTTQIGLLGWSQAGWIMPLAAAGSRDIAFLISVSGAGIPVAETTIDQARNEMTSAGMQPPMIEQIIDAMHLQYRFARTNEGWADYVAARETLVAQIGRAPASFPATQDDPYWASLRQLYFFDPTSTLHRLQIPTLALFGELDNNIVAEKNRAAWEAALRTAGNRDYTLRILPSANHLMLEARVGNNAEMVSLRRFVPSYISVVRDWLAARLRGSGSAR